MFVLISAFLFAGSRGRSGIASPAFGRGGTGIAGSGWATVAGLVGGTRGALAPVVRVSPFVGSPVRGEITGWNGYPTAEGRVGVCCSRTWAPGLSVVATPSRCLGRSDTGSPGSGWAGTGRGG